MNNIIKYTLDTVLSHNDFSLRKFTLGVKDMSVIGICSSVFGLGLIWKWIVSCIFYYYFLWYFLRMFYNLLGYFVINSQYKNVTKIIFTFYQYFYCLYTARHII